MEKEDIYLKSAILHICDSTRGLPLLADEVLEHGPEFSDFIASHIHKLIAGDEFKKCVFKKDSSEIYDLLKDYKDANFVDITRNIASYLYAIMNSNIDIPPADVIFARFRIFDVEYFAILKMNYKEFYTHASKKDNNGSQNTIVKNKNILPKSGQKLTEAAIINLSDLSIQLVEKKYEVNGEKAFYFSDFFLKCKTFVSEKSKLDIVMRAIKKAHGEVLEESIQPAQRMKAKEVLANILEEEGSLSVENLSERLFDTPECKIVFCESLDKYDLRFEKIEPKSESTTKSLEYQKITTSNGIELKIPMSVYKNPKNFVFETLDDGTTTIHLADMGYVSVHF